MPNVTKFYLTSSFLTALLCAFDVLSPLQLYLNADLILRNMEVRLLARALGFVHSCRRSNRLTPRACPQLWRLATNLIYFGTIAQPVNYLFHSYFMYTYLRDLEESVFERKSDLVYLFIFAAAIMEVRENPALVFVVALVCQRFTARRYRALPLLFACRRRSRCLPIRRSTSCRLRCCSWW
eukprot:COSAG02_NODE_5319_length_4442_cov_2.816947_4_plen_181_part_00